MVHIVLHEHLVGFELLDGGHIRLDAALRRLDREFDHLGDRVVRVLADLGQHRITQVLAHLAQRVGRGDAHAADVVGRVRIMHAARHGRQQGQRALGLERGHEQRLAAAQTRGNGFCRRVRGLAQFLEQSDLRVAVQTGGVDHVLPAGQRAAEQTVALLHSVPAVQLKLAAGHAVARAHGQALCLEQGLAVQLAILHKGHHVDRGQVAQAVAVQQDLAAGVAAVEVGAALGAGLLVDPARLTRVAHLLQVPVQLFAGGLAAVVDRVVAHLAVGN